MKKTETKNRLMAALAARRGEMIRFVQELVAIPTENPPGRAYPACVQAIARKLRQLKLPCEVLDIPVDGVPGRQHVPLPAEHSPPQFIRSFYGRGKKTLYFHGHYDVVPAQSAASLPWWRWSCKGPPSVCWEAVVAGASHSAKMRPPGT